MPGRFGWDFSNDGLVAFHFLPKFYFYRGVKRQENVDPGTEFNESQFLSLDDALTGVEIGPDPAGQGACDLSEQDFGLPVPDDHGAAFISGR